AQLIRGANQKLDGLGGLDGANQVDRAVEDSCGVTGFDRAFGRSREDAGQAGSFTRNDIHGYGVSGNGSSVNPRLAVLHGKIIDEIAGLKIVGRIEDEIGGGEQGLDVFRGEVGDLGLNLYVRIKGSNLAGGGDGFGQRVSGVSFVKERLALQVAGLNVIA